MVGIALAAYAIGAGGQSDRPTAMTIAHQAAVAASLPFGDRADFANGSSLATVHPSLWRQSALLLSTAFSGSATASSKCAVRTPDIALIKGNRGWIVIDTLTCEETARAAYDLILEKLGKRPISATILTHRRCDHFSGTSALLSDALPRVPIVASRGLLEATVSENVIAGPAMLRRAAIHLGATLSRNAVGSVSSGTGHGIAAGSI